MLTLNLFFGFEEIARACLRWLSIFSGDSDEETQSLIHGVGIWEYVGHVGVEPNSVPKAFSSGSEFPHAKAAQVILRPQFVCLLCFILLHKLFFQPLLLLGRLSNV